MTKSEIEKVTANPQVQHLLMQMQAYQQQMQALAMQSQQMEIQSVEIESAIKELSGEAREAVFKSAGPILVKVPQEEIRKELEEDLESTKIRVDVLKKQEEKVRQKLKEISEKLSPMLKGAGADVPDVAEGG